MFKVLIIALFSKCVFIEGQFVIGGLFYEGSEDMEVALNVSAGIFNFTTAIGRISRKGEVLEAGEKVCELVENHVIGIIDGTSGGVSTHVQAICDLLDIPHILIDHHDLVKDDWLYLNLNPSPLAYNMVLKELVTLKEWTNFTILYEKGYSLLRVTSLLEMASKVLTVSVRELNGLDYRDVLINARKNGYTNFVVDCPANKLEQFLKHAQQVGLMADEHSYIFLSPDLFTLDLTKYRYGGVNMTGFRLVNLEDQRVNGFINMEITDDTQPMPTKYFLIYDAVKVFSEGRSSMLDMEEPVTVNCNEFQSWEYGSSLLNFMKTSEIEGITRSLRFDDVGQRSDLTMEILELTPAGHLVVGKWETGNIKMARPFIPPVDTGEESIMKNKTFKILISTDAAPYAYLKNSIDTLEGNDRYEGFGIDLFIRLSEMLGFNYEFEHEADYGSYIDGVMTGMVLKIYTEKADFGICDFTITSDRQRAIDFSMPFMSLGISILYKKPSLQPPEMFSFMAVFAPEVWYNMVMIQMGLGVILIVVGRLSNKEWQNPVPCIEDPEELSNQFSFANSVWLIIGSVMQQGSEIAPIALAPRLITSIWWFFTMIMVASYVGTLVAFLTVEKNVLPFTNVEELFNDGSIAYGAKINGSTQKFFKNQTEGTMYRKMYERMINFENNEQGVKRAQEGSYAFLMESTTIEYFTERKCDLMQIGDLLDSKSYGIGMRKGSQYKKPIDDALLKLKENGELQKLKDLWWKEKRAGACGQEEEEETKQLGMKNMTGVFVVLGAGCIIGLIISVLDMLWGAFQRSLKYSTTYKYEIIKELKFALKFSGDIKPVKRPAKVDESDEALAAAEAEGKDEVMSLRSVLSSRSSAGTHRTCRSHHSSRHSPSSLSVAFARRRKYS